MTVSRHLAIDIGASGGRHVIGVYHDGLIQLTEVYRFNHHARKLDNTLFWDTQKLIQEILTGLRRCTEMGMPPDTVGIDSWGVDYALLDKENHLLGEVVAYRDHRTQGMDTRLESVLPFSRHYERTGIAKQPFNTVYQLMSEARDTLAKARSFLMVPDYFVYLLSGVILNEYTNASTTGLLSLGTKEYDTQILQYADIPVDLFSSPISLPGTIIGPISPSIADTIGCRPLLILPATHDTGSAFVANPSPNQNSVFLSSGTWSLLGIETFQPITTQAALDSGFTNEGGYNQTIRFLKNIMGLWILQSVRKEWDYRYSYETLSVLAQAGYHYPGVFDVNDERFFSPLSMVEEIKRALFHRGYPVPRDESELLYAIFNSLAYYYKHAIESLSAITGKTFSSVNIVGGGCQNALLNQLIADYTGLPIYAGPTEGSALGNIMVQMQSYGQISSLKEARESIRRSFKINEFKPQGGII